MGENLEGLKWTTQRKKYCNHVQMVPPVKNKKFTSTLTVQKVASQRQGESPTIVGGPNQMDHILRGGFDHAKNFNGMQQYKEMRDKVFLKREYV
jgi:hypothetical protein